MLNFEVSKNKKNNLFNIIIKNVKLKEAGKSKLVGRKLWFDDKFGRLNTEEKGIYLGTFEDDKLLVITCASILTWNGILPLWVGVPLVVRDVAMLSIGLLDSKLKETRVMPNLWGKSHAALAFLAIGIAIAQAANLFDYDVIFELIWPAVVVTLAVSTTVYFLEWRRLRVEYDSKSSVAM